MIEIIDNIISVEEQNHIKNLLLNRSFPWFYLNDVSFENNTLERKPGLSHYFIKEGKVSSDWLIKQPNNISKLIDSSANFLKKEELKIVKSRAFLQFPLSEEMIKGNYIDTPHLDLKEKHIALLYYGNDSDGDTIIYEDVKKNKIKKTVKPKQGRMVIFDGSYWHTGSQPRNNIRCIINTDITK